MTIIRFEDSADDANARGEAMLDEGNFEKAMPEFLHAIALAPEDERGWANLARAYGEGGALWESIRIYLNLFGRNSLFAYLREVGRNLLASGKRETADLFMESGMDNFIFPDFKDNLRDIFHYRLRNFSTVECTKEDSEFYIPPEDAEEGEDEDLIDARQLRAKRLYDEILDLEEAENYPDMMNAAMRYPEYGKDYNNVLELICEYTSDVFEDQGEAERYARKLREICPEAAEHFRLLYPTVSEEEREAYYMETANAVEENGYPRDMDTMIFVLTDAKDYERAARCLARFEQILPYREKFWQCKVALAYLRHADGKKAFLECKRIFPHAPFIDRLEWAIYLNRESYWQKVTHGYSAAEPEADGELWRYDTGKRNNGFASSREQAAKLRRILLRTRTFIPNFNDVRSRKAWLKEDEILREALLSDEVDYRVKAEILNLLIMTGATGEYAVLSEWRLCRGRFDYPPTMGSIEENPEEASDRVYILRTLMCNLMLSGDGVDLVHLDEMVRKLKEKVPHLYRRKTIPVIAFLHAFYSTEKLNPSDYENIARYYKLPTKEVEAVRKAVAKQFEKPE